MAKLNPVLRYAIMANKDKMASHKPVCQGISLSVLKLPVRTYLI
jgi:hypothetical protein